MYNEKNSNAVKQTQKKLKHGKNKARVTNFVISFQPFRGRTSVSQLHLSRFKFLRSYAFSFYGTVTLMSDWNVNVTDKKVL